MTSEQLKEAADFVLFDVFLNHADHNCVYPGSTKGTGTGTVEEKRALTWWCCLWPLPIPWNSCGVCGG